MTYLPFLQEAWQTVRSNQWRSLLTVFGIFWGVFIMVLLSCVGTVVSEMVGNVLDNTGERMVCFSSMHTTKPYNGYGTGRIWEISRDEVKKITEAMGQKIQVVAHTAHFYNKKHLITQGSKSAHGMLHGVDSPFIEYGPYLIMSGRNFNRADSEQMRSVCLLGTNLSEQLFGDKDPLGKQIEMEGHFYTVVGTVEGMVPIANQPEASRTVFLPIELMQQLYMGGSKIVNSVGFSFNPQEDIHACIQEVRQHLAKLYDLNPEDENAMFILNLNDYDKAFVAMGSGSALLAILGGTGILLAALLGVSTIILATIKDRTRDIAMRRVIGASNWDIILQIMSESLLLSCSGGLLGLFAACWAIQLGRNIMESMGYQSSMLYLSLPSVTTALLVIVIGGMAASIIPIRKALSIELVEALSKD